MEQKRMELIKFRNRMMAMANDLHNGLHLRSECKRDAMNADAELKRRSDRTSTGNDDHKK